MRVYLAAAALAILVLCPAVCKAIVVAPYVTGDIPYYDEFNDLTQYGYRIEGQSYDYSVDAFDLYAHYDPSALTPAIASGYNWTVSIEADGYGGARLHCQANSVSSTLGHGDWIRVSISAAGQTDTDYNYQWPGFAGQTNWSYRQASTGAAPMIEGFGKLGVPSQVPEPGALAALALGCVGALVRRRR